MNLSALTERQIKELPISFALLMGHGGWINWSQLSDLQLALRDTGSFSHLSFNHNSILNQESTLCYIILKHNVPEDHTAHRRLDVWDLGSRHRMVGLCFLFFPYPADKSTAQIGVALIPEARRNGYGRAAIHKLLAYAFDALKVHRVVAQILCPTSPDKPPSARKQIIFDTKKLRYVFERFGFQAEGVTRAAVLAGSSWQDVHRLSILDTDWMSMHMGSSFAHDPSSGAQSVSTPWEEMERRHEAERAELRGWREQPTSSNIPMEDKGDEIMNSDEDDEDTCYGGDGSSDDYEGCDD
jgi:GNAT superfamily N-acetyltransferase